MVLGDAFMASDNLRLSWVSPCLSDTGLDGFSFSELAIRTSTPAITSTAERQLSVPAPPPRCSLSKSIHKYTTTQAPFRLAGNAHSCIDREGLT